MIDNIMGLVIIRHHEVCPSNANCTQSYNMQRKFASFSVEISIKNIK